MAQKLRYQRKGKTGRFWDPIILSPVSHRSELIDGGNCTHHFFAGQLLLDFESFSMVNFNSMIAGEALFLAGNLS